jgi:hypothetical protein
MVSTDFYFETKSVGKRESVEGQLSLFWLGSEIWLEQLAYGLKWPSGNGENGRSQDKDEL